MVKREGRRLRKISVERTPAETTHSSESSRDTGSTVEVSSNPEGALVSATSGSDPADQISDEMRSDDAKALAAEVTAREALPEESLDPEVADAVPDIPEHGYEHDYESAGEEAPRRSRRPSSEESDEESETGESDDDHPDGVDNEPRFRVPSPTSARWPARPKSPAPESPARGDDFLHVTCSLG